MIWFVVTHLFSTLLDLVRIGRLRNCVKSSGYSNQKLFLAGTAS